MADRPLIGLRYCGGCNPRYDRVRLARRLEESLPQLEFEPARPGTGYAAVAVICGCTARCAGVSDLALPADRLIYLVSEGDLAQARERLSGCVGREIQDKV